jgi:hypothetical protein
VLDEFYAVLLPLSLLIALATRDPLFLLLVAAHVAAFPVGTRRMVRETGAVLLRLLRPWPPPSRPR